MPDNDLGPLELQVGDDFDDLLSHEDRNILIRKGAVVDKFVIQHHLSDIRTMGDE
jgi:hypothetical protein